METEPIQLLREAQTLIALAKERRKRGGPGSGKAYRQAKEAAKERIARALESMAERMGLYE